MTRRRCPSSVLPCRRLRTNGRHASSFSPDGRYLAAVTDQDLTGAGARNAGRASSGTWLQAEHPSLGTSSPRRTSSATWRSYPTRSGSSSPVPTARRSSTSPRDRRSARSLARYPPTRRQSGRNDARRSYRCDARESPSVCSIWRPGNAAPTLAGHRRAAHPPRLQRGRIEAGIRRRRPPGDGLGRRQRPAARRVRGHAAAINALAFSPDGKTLWSAGDDRAIFAWDLQRADTLVHRASPAVADGPALPGDSVDMIIGPGGRYVAYPTADVVPFQIRDVATGALGPPSAVRMAGFMSFSPDGDRYVTVDERAGCESGTRATGAVLADSEGSGRLFSCFPAGAKAVFTPDGRHVLALSRPLTIPTRVGRVPETLVVLDATTLAPVGGEPVPLGYAGRTISVTPDGRQAVVVVEHRRRGRDEGSPRRSRDASHRPFDAGRAGVRPARQRARNNTVAPDGRTVGIGGTPATSWSSTR